MNFGSHEQNQAPQDEAQDLNEALSEPDGEFVAEPKKQMSPGTMLVGGLVLACAAATYFMYVKNGPQSASASINPEAAAANATINGFLEGSGKDIKAMTQLLENAENTRKQLQVSPELTQVPVDQLATNPFRKSSAKPQAAVEEDALKKKQEEQRVAALKAVQALQLQTILHSDARKACMINNHMYQEGSTVEDFTIEQISPKTVVVRNGVYRFELRMQR